MGASLDDRQPSSFCGRVCRSPPVSSHAAGDRSIATRRKTLAIGKTPLPQTPGTGQNVRPISRAYAPIPAYIVRGGRWGVIRHRARARPTLPRANSFKTRRFSVSHWSRAQATGGHSRRRPKGSDRKRRAKGPLVALYVRPTLKWRLYALFARKPDVAIPGVDQTATLLPNKLSVILFLKLLNETITR